MTDLEKRIFTEADSRQNELYQALSRLVMVNTENFATYGNEKNIVPCLSGLYEQIGLEPDAFSPMSLPGFAEHEAYLPGNHLEDRPDICAVWPGTEGKRRVMIAGHIDTVQIGDEAKWSVPPLSGLIRDDKIWGRGAVDDKQGIAAGWFAVKVLQACGVRLKDDVVLAAYCDEETGGGHGALAAVLKYPSAAYLNLDGCNGIIYTHGAGGGCFAIRFRLRHPTETAEPVYKSVAAFIDAMARFGQRRRDELEANPVFAGSSTAAQAYRLNRILVGGTGGTDMGSGTVNFMFYSLLPKKEIDAELTAVLEEIKPVLDAQQVEVGPFEHTTRYFLPVMPAAQVPIAELFSGCIAGTTGKPAESKGMCLSDMPMFYYYGQGEVFSYGVGGGFAEYGGAHQIDEHVGCGDLLNMAKGVMLFLLRYSL